MKNRKKFMLVLGSMIISTVVMSTNPAFASTFIVLTRDQAIDKYQKYYTDYTKQELVQVQQYRTAYHNIKGSLADQVVERAIWYMDNGYMVYGHGYMSYEKYGIVDCSEFPMLVYKDFGFNITEVSAKYDSVGKRVEGVKKVKDGKHWKLVGTENLRPGDILTWQQDDHINHVAIYMGMVNGQPLVIGTRSNGNPTAIGTVNDFRYWWGEKFHSARRVLPEGSWTPGKVIAGHEDKGPVIPKSYVLPPQKQVFMPTTMTSTESTFEKTTAAKYVSPVLGTSTTEHEDSGNTGTTSVWTTANTGDKLNIVKSVYLRQKSELGSEKVSLLKAGTTVKVITQYNRYNYFVEDQNGRRGYITTSKNYVSPVQK